MAGSSARRLLAAVQIAAWAGASAMAAEWAPHPELAAGAALVGIAVGLTIGARLRAGRARAIAGSAAAAVTLACAWLGSHTHGFASWAGLEPGLLRGSAVSIAAALLAFPGAALVGASFAVGAGELGVLALGAAAGTLAGRSQPVACALAAIALVGVRVGAQAEPAEPSAAGRLFATIAGATATAIALVTVRTQAALGLSAPSGLLVGLAAVTVGAAFSLRAAALAAPSVAGWVALPATIVASAVGALPRALHVSLPAWGLVAPGALALAALVAAARQRLRPALLVGAALPLVGAAARLPLRVIATSAAVGATLMVARTARRPARAVLALLIAALLLHPPRPRLADLAAWRLGLAPPSFARDGRFAPVFIVVGDLYAGATEVEPAAAHRRPLAAALASALVPSATRALLVGLSPALTRALGEAGFDVTTIEAEPALAEAEARLGGGAQPLRGRVVRARSAVALARAAATGQRWQLVFSRGQAEAADLTHLRAVLEPQGVLVHALPLGTLDEPSLRRTLGVFAREIPHVLLAMPDEQTLLVLGSLGPLRLDAASATDHPALLLAAGIHTPSDVLANIVGDRALCQALASAPSGGRSARALGLILGPLLVHAAPPPELLGAVAWASYADRVVLAVARGELPGWRVAAAMAAPDRVSSGQRAYHEAVLLAARGQASEARAKLEEALRLSPDDPAPARELGRLLVEAGDRVAAREPLVRVAAKTALPSDRLAAARVLVLDGDPTARPTLTELAASEPRARAWLGVLDAEEGRLADAERELSAAARAMPADDAVWLELGALRWRRREEPEARRTLAQAVAIAGRAAAEDARLGGERLELGDPLGAVILLRRAIARDPLPAQPHRLLARAYLRIGQRADAARAADEYGARVGRASREARELRAEIK
jgi:Flp pilus assembly protein TadD